MLFGRGECTVGQLRTILDGLRDFSVAAGAKTAAADLKVFSDMLEPFSARNVSAVCEEIKAKLAAGGATPRTMKKRATPKVNLSEAKIQQYVGEFQRAGTDRVSFEDVLRRLAVDKSLKAADVSEVARQYTSGATKYKSIAAAREDIEKAFVRNARFENKLR